MNRTTAFSAALAVLAFAGTPARAADEDVQLWITETGSLPLSSAVQGTLDLSQRFRENGDQLLTRGTVDFRLSPSVTVGGGAAYVATLGSADELRPHQQLTVALGPVSLRTRVEERFFYGADRMELRLRQRIAATVPLTQRLKAGITGELLYTARARNDGEGSHVDSWRGGATLSRRFGEGLEGTAGYLAIYSPRDGGPDKLSHVAQLTLTLRR